MIIKRFFPILTLLISILILSQGCRDDPSAMLADRIWTFKSLHTDSELASVLSSVYLSQAFFNGARLEFSPGGEYLIRFPLMEIPTRGNWSLAGGDQLILTPDHKPASTSRILTLIDKELTYIETLAVPDSGTYAITTTWVRE